MYVQVRITNKCVTTLHPPQRPTDSAADGLLDDVNYAGPNACLFVIGLVLFLVSNVVDNPSAAVVGVEETKILLSCETVFLSILS